MKRTVFTLAALSFLTLLFVTHGVHAQPIFQRSGDTAPGLGKWQNEKLTLMQCIAGDPSRSIPAGSCSTEHFFILANNIIRWIVGIVGALALFMYVIGGLWMIFSAGSSTRIGRGKDILIGTTIALVFTLTSWLIISFVLQGLGVTSDYTIAPAQCNATGDCPTGKICDNKVCVDRCFVEKAKTETDPSKQWGCKEPTSCAMQSVSDCQVAQNCVPNLCSDATTVCCY